MYLEHESEEVENIKSLGNSDKQVNNIDYKPSK